VQVIIDQMPVWVQWLATLIGITFLWLAIFVTPSEHKLFSDILEEWWFRVETLRERGLSTVGAILVLVAEKFGSVADALFGTRIVSAHAIASSIGLSIVSVALCELCFFVVLIIFYNETRLALWFVLGRGTIGVLLGISVILFDSSFPNRSRLHLTVAITVGVGAICFIITPFFFAIVNSIAWFREEPSIHRLSYVVTNVAVPVVAAFTISFISDVMFIAIMRRTLRRIAAVGSATRSLALLAMTAILAAVLIGLPAWIDAVINFDKSSWPQGETRIP
jgi:hypothetical protein